MGRSSSRPREWGRSHRLGAGAGTTESAVEDLERQNVGPVAVRETWRDAARFKGEYNVALGDAFALAAAEHVDGTLLVGADDDFDAVEEVRIERFRAEGSERFSSAETFVGCSPLERWFKT